MRILIVILLLAIVFSLARGLFFLTRGEHDSKRLANALTWRVALTAALLASLVIAAMMGWIEPGNF